MRAYSKTLLQRCYFMTIMQKVRNAQYAGNRLDDAWLKRTRLFAQAERLRAEVNVHKWYESERAGRDIGWDRAAVSYAIFRSQQRPPSV